MSVMKTFLEGQQRREEGFLAELRGLRASLLAPPLGQPRYEQWQAGPSPAPTQVTSPPEGSSRSLEPPTAASQQHHSSPVEASASRVSSRPELLSRPGGDPKIPQFLDNEDIENYLLRYERIARTWGWPESEWACRLVPLLTGKALEAYTAMDEERAHSYPDLKAALLEKFDISPETYRQKFRSMTIPPGENPTETYHRLKGLYRRWIRPEQFTKEQIGEQIIMEQLLRVFPPDIRTWVKEHEPTEGLAAAKLALQYINARRPAGPAVFQSVPVHASSRPRPAAKVIPPPHGESSLAPSQRGPGKEFVCFYCQQTGHKASTCPLRKTKLTGACYTPRAEDIRPAGRQQHFKAVTINGEPVTALADSGSFLTLVRRELVPTSSLDYSRQEEIVCVHGDRHSYPTADLMVVVNEQPYLLTVGVVEKLPVAAILGWDLPVLLDVLMEKQDQDLKGVAGAVITRAQAKAMKTSSPKKEKEPEPEPFSTLDNSLFEGGTKGPRKSRRQRRFEKGLKSKEPDVKGGLAKDMWEVPGDIAALQRDDETLKPLFEKTVAVDVAKGDKDNFTVDRGVLYVVSDGVKRLVVPGACRPMIMHLAHTVPWAGHLGRNKTYLRIASRFFWPSMYSDVQNYCKTCPTCQKTCNVRQSDRAYLQPLPVISTPFRRIAMDIVGPLIRSSRGHEYILVVCDYATRFPEAFPLRTITAPAVLRCLVQLFSRVGVPDEIVTDQGTNFTSRLLQLFHQQLGISAIKTTPYHPQTDGLVERFNQTLKKMLQKFVADTGRDWDQWLPFMLFAYREVPQASTGFSPFELLYGWEVQGPLDLLLKTWEAPATEASDRSVVRFVIEMRERLAQYQDEAEVNLREAQRTQKVWYDQHARQRELQPGQKVLLLLPSSNSKLLAKWQGPYTVLRKMGPVTYEIHHPDKKKAKQVYHINLLKEWKEAPAPVPAPAPGPVTSLVVTEVDSEGEEEETTLVNLRSVQPVPDHLSSVQSSQLSQVFQRVSKLFAANPGRTVLVEHGIRLKDQGPVRQRSYRVPQHLVAKLLEEVQEMQRLGVIEPSQSEWCSPVVIVVKKDGSLRICIDFRRLNAMSEFDAYPMPRIEDLLERVGRARFITTLDLCKGYWQVPLKASCRPYTAFRTPAGLFQFTVMPFGLHGAPATFQRLMDKVLQGCEDCSAAYLDDVVIFSDTWEQHLQHLSRVLGQIQQAGLTLNPAKCQWAKEEATYLGYRLGRGEVRPQVDKIEAIRRCPQPRTKKEVRSFLGLAGWYRRFVPQFATIAAPLTALTAKDQRNPVIWNEDCETAFQTLKTCLCSSPVLRSPDFNQRFLVQTDASAVGLGAVLAQGKPGEEQPVLYLSRKLLPRETRYSTVEKEGLAIKWTLESLRYYLLGREFDLETDHRALTWINSMKDHNSRLTRWYLSLQPFRFQIRHRAGKMNIVADFLSRLPHIVNLREEGDNVKERL